MAILLASFLPDEYFGCFIRRNKELNCDYGFSRSEYAARRMNFRTEKAYDPLPKNYTPTYGELELLNKTTLYPLAEKLGVERKEVTCITPTRTWRICPRCVVEDIGKIGVAYINRKHVIPSVNCCYQHGEILLSSCPVCMIDIKRHRISEFYNCSRHHGFYSVQGPLALGAVEFARFLSDLLSTPTIPVSHMDVKRVIELELSKLGYGELTNINYRRVSMDMAELMKLGDHKNGFSFCFSLFPGSRFHPLLRLCYFAFRTADAYLNAVSKVCFPAVSG